MRTVLLFALIGLSCTSAEVEVRDSDAGDFSYARQIVPKLLGRKPRGCEEVNLLVDMMDKFGRDAVVDEMMTRPDFYAQWSDHVVDWLDIPRGYNPGVRYSGAQCYSEKLHPLGASNLTAHIRAASPTIVTSFSSPFHMGDVIDSALKNGDLSTVYQARLFGMGKEVKYPSSPVATQLERQHAADLFQKTYLNRNMGCLTCHTSDWSTTGAEPFDRHHPILGSFEKALFGSSRGMDPRKLGVFFRSDPGVGASAPWGLDTGACTAYKAPGDIPPDPLYVNSDPEDVIKAYLAQQYGNGTAYTLSALFRAGATGLADGLSRTIPPPEECGACATCQSTGQTVDLSLQDTVRQHFVQAGCFGCHASGTGGFTMTEESWLEAMIRIPANHVNGGGRSLVEPQNVLASALVEALEGATGPSMPKMPLDSADALLSTQIQDVKDWINSLPMEAGCTSCSDCSVPSAVPGDEAFAYLTAANVVDQSWEVLFGERLTISNHFPRNADQRKMLQALIEQEFLPEGWDLRAPIKYALTSSFFNRLSPAQNNHPTGQVYEIPMLFDPWVQADPRLPPLALLDPATGAYSPDPNYDASANPENHFNNVGASVHRYSARTLLNSVHETLGWPKPGRFPCQKSSGLLESGDCDPLAYPSVELRRAAGQEIHGNLPGAQGIDFKSLLTWYQRYDDADKSTVVAMVDSDGVPQPIDSEATPQPLTQDWYDALMAAVVALPANDPLTLEDLVLTMKNWFFADPYIESTASSGPSERDALAAFFADQMGLIESTALSTPVASISSNPNLGMTLRRLGGALLSSPQFMLAGLASTRSCAPPALTEVCNPGQPCSYKDMCEEAAPRYNALGYALLCPGAHGEIIGMDVFVGQPRELELPGPRSLLAPYALTQSERSALMRARCPGDNCRSTQRLLAERTINRFPRILPRRVADEITQLVAQAQADADRRGTQLRLQDVPLRRSMFTQLCLNDCVPLTRAMVELLAPELVPSRPQDPCSVDPQRCIPRSVVHAPEHITPRRYHPRGEGGPQLREIPLTDCARANCDAALRINAAHRRSE